METRTRRAKDWVLTPESFDKLLAAFAPDRDLAAVEYEAARVRLIKLFRWRGVSEAEDAADESLNRVARKLEAGEAVQNLSAYIGGVARLVLLEKLKEKPGVPLEDVAPEALRQAPREPDSAGEQRLACFSRCLGELPAEPRELILNYYGAEAGAAKIENRKKLAARLGLEINALRNRALRVRERLESCIEICSGDSKRK